MKFKLFIFSLGAMATLFLACGDDTARKTPSDITDKIAFLNGESALPHFPFGNNHIYMFFYAEWCPYSQGMRDKVFPRPEIIEFMNENFTCIAIVPDSIEQVEFLGKLYSKQQLLYNFKIEDYPAHYFCSSDGKLLGATKGEQDIRQFKQLLTYYAKEYYKKMDFNAFLKTDDATEIDTVYGEF